MLGDVHGNVGWLRTIALSLRALAPDITTILQLGDWWMDHVAVDDVFADTSITRVYVTLGNHEPWDMVTPIQNAHPGAAVRVSEVTWLLPRPARLSIGGRTVLSLGGAASVDRLWRIEGAGWWADERITDAHVDAAIAGGPADLMLTHESPARTPVRAVREVLRTNPMGFPDETLAESKASRARVAQVWDAVRPDLLMHGHMHVVGGGVTDDGRRVASLGRDVREGNLGFLDLRTLRMETPSVRQIRAAAYPDE
ncbi:metallophosphoesterase [Microbacterium sp. NPDC090225]|uniref:metallophosphoesterase n=1 Tax=Microbacterium sp. NPDC090225 TaxID=3364207 RepID=UPI00382D392E